MGNVSPTGNAKSRQWVLIGLSLGAASLVAPRAWAETTPPNETPASGDDDTVWIVGGNTVSTCGWPSTVSLGGCTGTLIHPRVVATAAHCSPKAGQKISFGEKSPWAFTITATKCLAGMRGGTADWAYCILPEDDRLKQVPIIPPIHGCERAKFLKPGATVTAVGFGITSSRLRDLGIKRQVDVKITKVTDLTVEVDGDAKHGLCHGDSGGPLFIHLVEGTKDYGWRSVGSVTGLVSGTGGDCAGGTRYMSFNQHIAQVEMNEKIDVTPCTNAAGDWEPGPDCRNIPTDPANGGGMWPACMAGAVTGAVASCGAATDPGPGAADGGVDVGTVPDVRPIADARDTGSSSGSGGSGGSGGSTVADAGSTGSGGVTGSGGSTVADAGMAASDGRYGGSGGAPGSTAGARQVTGSGCAVGAGSGSDGTAWLAVHVGIASTLAYGRRRTRPARRRP